MRYLLLVAMLGVSMPILGYNESVAAISYNPSRFGSFTHLKAVQGATLAGGVNIDETLTQMNIVSQGTVSLQHTGVQCADGTYTSGCTDVDTIANISPMSFVPNCGDSNGISYLVHCSSPATSVTGSAVLQANKGRLVADYVETAAKLASETVPSNVNENSGVTVTMYGGTLKATNAYVKSFVNTLSLKVKVNTSLRVVNSLNINDSLRLGNVNISQPSGTAANNKKYAFVDRVDDYHKRHKVLTVQKN